MAFVYHGSDKGNLGIIQPRSSTHGKKYVYATRHRTIALLFLSRWNDYLLTLETTQTKNGIHITLVERYQNALHEIYAHKTGYLYMLDAANFFSDPNCWDMEVVSSCEETPVSCERVDDILLDILSLKENGDISLYFYPQRPPNIPFDDSDLIQKTIALFKLSGDTYNAVYCAKRFPHLKEQLQKTFFTLYGIDVSSV